MKILAIDTATPSCSVALTDGDQLLGESTLVNDETHSRHVMVMIKQVLEMSGVTMNEVDGFAATHGPGTFTGLRIGMSTVKGLADALDKPVVGVSSLAALAWQANTSLLICPLIDARRSEVYFAHYRFEKGRLKEVTPETVGPIEKTIPDIDTRCCFIGGGASLYVDLIKERLGQKAVFTPSFQNVIRASVVAFIARELLFNYDPTQDRDRFLPQYLRPSDAEINLKKRRDHLKT